MVLNIIVESKCFEKTDPELHADISNDPCEYCSLRQELECMDRKLCKWYTEKAIYVKVRCEEYIEKGAL